MNIYKEITKMERKKHRALLENDSMNFGDAHVSKKGEPKINSQDFICKCRFAEPMGAYSFEKDSVVTCCPVCGGKRVTNNDKKLLGRVIL